MHFKTNLICDTYSICLQKSSILFLQDISPDATAILIPETAHCANMYPEKEDDPPQLKQARVTVANR